MSFPKELTAILDEHNAVLIRADRHRIYRLPNGRKLTVSNSPSSPFSVKYLRRDIKKALAAVEVASK